MAKLKTTVIPNQVFIGCPRKTVRPKYERLMLKMRKKYPLSFIIIGREEDQDADDLLAVIKQKLLSSSYAVFDVTTGNANVSLEFGLAEASGIERALYFCTHKAGSRQSAPDSAIIADLAGKRRVQYKQEKQLAGQLGKLCTSHNYTRRFEKFLKDNFRRASKGRKKRNRALALKIVHELDDQQARRRDDVVQAMLAEGYNAKEIDETFRRLNKSGLLVVTPGRYSAVEVR